MSPGWPLGGRVTWLAFGRPCHLVGLSVKAATLQQEARVYVPVPVRPPGAQARGVVCTGRAHGRGAGCSWGRGGWRELLRRIWVMNGGWVQGGCLVPPPSTVYSLQACSDNQGP